MAALPMKETISFRIEKSNREQLDLLAKAINSDRSSLIDDAIRAYLEFNSWFLKEVELGVADADAGDFATDSEVEETFARLTGE
jgi:predicted transcriptional regulator